MEEDQDTEGEDIPDEPEEEDWQNEDGDEDGELTAFIREAKEGPALTASACPDKKPEIAPHPGIGCRRL